MEPKIYDVFISEYGAFINGTEIPGMEEMIKYDGLRSNWKSYKHPAIFNKFTCHGPAGDNNHFRFVTIRPDYSFWFIILDKEINEDGDVVYSAFSGRLKNETINFINSL